MKVAWNDIYDGPRFTYGLRYRPPVFGGVPQGWIINSHQRYDRRFEFGTIQYPRRLSAREVRQFELIEVQ